MVKIMCESLDRAVTMKMTISRDMIRVVEETVVRREKIADTMIPTW
jgi:hypothetical protein